MTARVPLSPTPLPRLAPGERGQLPTPAEKRGGARVLLALALAAVAAPASALQPLDEFLRGARAANPDVAEARAARRQLGAEADAALGRALPRLSLRGTYTRNEHEVRLPPGAGGAVLSPREQWDGSATLDVPLLDLARFARVGAARAGARAQAWEEAATGLRVESQVSQDYHQLVANLALVASSRRALEVAREGLRIAEQRHGAGAAARLDVDRARAEVERNVQQVAGADLEAALVARSLRSLTSVAPETEAGVVLADDLHEEPPLESFERPDPAFPGLAAAIQRRVAAEKEARAQRLSLVPSLSATLTERVTDFEPAPGQETAWQAVVGLAWTFDLGTLAGIRAQAAAAEGARAREQRVRLAARDEVHRTWETVRTTIARSRSARVQAEVTTRAADLALERYQVGEGTQLDLLQAQRDAFAAEAGRIQADADLLNARAQLRLAAGESLLERRPRGTP